MCATPGWAALGAKFQQATAEAAGAVPEVAQEAAKDQDGLATAAEDASMETDPVELAGSAEPAPSTGTEVEVEVEAEVEAEVEVEVEAEADVEGEAGVDADAEVEAETEDEDEDEDECGDAGESLIAEIGR